MSSIVIGVSAGYLVYLAFVWLTGSVLGLKGTDLWIFRIVLGLLGVIGAAAFLWFKKKNKKTSTAVPASISRESDVDSLLKRAESRLTSSRLGRGAKFGKLPIVLLVGDSSSAKTTTMVRCGLDPEHLAGHIHRDNNVIPTETVNCWFSKKTVFIEAGGPLLADPNTWWRVIRRLKRNRLLSFTGRDRQATRAVVACVSAEDFLTANASQKLEELARNLRARLEELSHLLGIRLPVYVLFTKSDRIPFFPEYVRNLSEAEATQVFGTTLPIERYDSDAVFAERETERLGTAFQNLVYGLCDKRPEFLAREHDPKKLHAIYEFPREFGKLRTSMVRFLVDLCRPSQLRVAPFVRGFYFSGVRAIVPDELVPVPAPVNLPAEDFDGSATRIFRPSDTPNLQPPQPAAQSRGRRIPQWTFLNHFLTDVLLEDKVGLGTSHASVKASMIRRVAAAAAVLGLLVFALGMTISYFGNRALQKEAISATRGIAESPSAAGGPPSLDDLTRLDTLRLSVEKLTRYEMDRPWRIGWGLYSGHKLYPEVRQAYYGRFQQLLFANSQAGLVAFLKTLLPPPQPTDNLVPAYEALKAYLIATSNHDKSTKTFLPPVLMRHWTQGQNLDTSRTLLAQKQFDFYSEDLIVENPYSKENDGPLVERARRYLTGYMSTDRIYEAMLADAATKGRTINFNVQFPGSEEVLKVEREVRPAFTKEAFAFMQTEALKNIGNYFNGDEWVLGDQTQAASSIDGSKLAQDLLGRYTTAFIEEWRAFIASAKLAVYRDVGDGARKLKRLSSNQSLLLELFSLVAQNTSVESLQIKEAFQAPQSVAPIPNPLIGPSNDAYITALQTLQVSLDTVASSPGGSGNEAMISETRVNAGKAKVATSQVANAFKDTKADIEVTVQTLMEAPITYVESLVKTVVPGELNAAGKSFCSQLQDLMTKYPFNGNPASPRQATLKEMHDLFHPQEGALGALYTSKLSKYLVRQGSRYIENTAGGVEINPAFLNFWNRAADFSEAVYGTSSQPRLTFSLKPTMMRGIDQVALKIGPDTLNASSTNAPTQSFTWTGAPDHIVQMNVSMAGGKDQSAAPYEGTWAVFRFFADADSLTPSGSGYSMERVMKNGNQPFLNPDKTRVSILFDLDIKVPIFQKGYFDGLKCVSTIARP